MVPSIPGSTTFYSIKFNPLHLENTKCRMFLEWLMTLCMTDYFSSNEFSHARCWSFKGNSLGTFPKYFLFWLWTYGRIDFQAPLWLDEATDYFWAIMGESGISLPKGTRTAKRKSLFNSIRQSDHSPDLSPIPRNNKPDQHRLWKVVVCSQCLLQHLLDEI